jgi:hypothetical protein
VLLASTGECTAEHIAAARMVLLATELCDIQITLHDIRSAFDWRLRQLKDEKLGDFSVSPTYEYTA